MFPPHDRPAPDRPIEPSELVPFALDTPQLRALDALLRATPDFVAVNDRDGKYVYVGVAAALVFGLKPEQMLGRALDELPSTAELWSTQETHRRKVLATGEPQHGELRLGDSGEAHVYEYTISPVRDADGQIQASLCIARDVSERRRYQEALQLVMSGARCILWYADVYEVGNPNFLVWNQRLLDEEAAQRFLPMDRLPGETYHQAWYRCRQPDDRDACDRKGTASLRAGQSYRQEFRCRCADGETRWVREDVHVETVVPGQCWRATAVCTDITEYKLAEEERERLYREAAELNRRLGRSMLETHHRVKNSLQLIAGLLDMTLMEHERDLPAADVRRIVDQVMALAAIHDLLTSDVRDGGSQPETVSTRTALDRLLDMVGRTLPRGTIERGFADIALPIQTITALSLATQELVANAVKHGGSNVRVGLERSGTGLRLTVADNGPGFPPAFDPATAGTGLQLVRMLARHDLQGAVTFSNGAAGGACVRLEFPAPPTR